MSIAPNTIEPQPTPAQRAVIAIMPAPIGWWVLHDVRCEGRLMPAVMRARVVAWAHVEISDQFGTHQTLEAMVDGDGARLRFVPELARPWIDVRLWHDGDTWCTCRSTPHPIETVDDVWWCEECGGTINPDRWP